MNEGANCQDIVLLYLERDGIRVENVCVSLSSSRKYGQGTKIGDIETPSILRWTDVQMAGGECTGYFMYIYLVF